MSAAATLLRAGATAAPPERKLLPAPVARVATDGTFEGYASLFGIADLGRDVVLPGAFAGSLAQRGVAGIKLLWQHDPNEPIGRWLAIAEDPRGLFVRGRLNLAVARAREIHALMSEGAIDGLSIGFRTVEAARDRASGLRRLTKVDLWEISLVTFPLLPGARVGKGRVAERPLPKSLPALSARLAGLTLELRTLRLARLLQRKCRSDQPRVPAGSSDGGRWAGGEGGSRSPDQRTRRRRQELRIAQDDTMARLLAELPYAGGGRFCVYELDGMSIIIPGPNYARCQSLVPSSAIRHGRRLNDN